MFGEKIKKLRKQRGLRQEDLARKVGVSRCTIATWESQDGRRMSVTHFVALAAALGVSLEVLLREEV